MCYLTNGCKSKKYFEKTRHVKKTTNLNSIYYVDKEIQDIKKEAYLTKGIHSFII